MQMNGYAELVQRSRTILYFSGDHEFFKISPGLKSLYDRGSKPIHLLARKV